MASIVNRAKFLRKVTSSNLAATVAPERDLNSNDFVKKDPTGATRVEVKPQTELEANIQLRKLEKKHRWDPNLPRELIDGIGDATARLDVTHESNVVDELLEDSPYPEVRAAVRNVSVFGCLAFKVALLTTR